MKLSTLLVAVRKISSVVPRSDFPEDNIEALAKLILEAQGLINPIILNRTSLESFDVVEGHFEYYAAVRAREIDLRQGEMINAFILEPDNQEIIEQQIKLLRLSVSIPSNNLDARLNNLETRLTKTYEELQQQQRQLNTKLEQLEGKLLEKVDPLQLFNHAEIEQLSRKLRVVYSQQLPLRVQAIVDNRPYKSLSEIVERVTIKGGKKTLRAISEKKMLEIIEQWLNLVQ
ncbi:hypothetical protein [Gloeocapsa sp. PCC 73106]|uniref:hypothetical protein n=1 Tax=Gloeocapsa sp. PCC 73106 TaxID=102232 RepID=UPI0002AC1DC7|nr:hypothetical protein [Gloeocapsa sp. PCC 73106]ELR98192.1 hypothetical protein GLO73106DRAFT_00020190 [Gloeocapsa sp. PCC 73106]